MFRTDATPIEVEIQLRTRNKRRRLRKPPVWLYPYASEQKYRGRLLDYVETMAKVIRETIYPHLESVVFSRNLALSIDRADDFAEEIDRLMEATTLGVSRIPFDKKTVASDIGYDINTFNSRQWDKQLKTTLGIDVFRREEFTPAVINSFVKENVSLITKMESDLLRQVDEIVQRNVRAGASAETIRAEIQGRIGVSKSRAKLIARDQTGKLNGQMTQLRQKNLGLNRYTWRTSTDERVRSTHQAHAGNKYSWDTPPANTGHPGQDYQCRCYAEPDFEELLGETTEAPPVTTTAPAPTATPRKAKKRQEKPKTLAGRFVPAKTVKEAEEWARVNNLADAVSYVGMEVESSNAFNLSVAGLLEQFPEARKRLDFIGSKKGWRQNVVDKNIEIELERWIFRNRLGLKSGRLTLTQVKKSAEKHIKSKIHRVQSNVYGFALHQGRRGENGIVFNDAWKFGRIESSFKNTVKTGYHPPAELSPSGVKAIIDHETGHIIDYTFNLRTDPDIVALWRQQDYKSVSEGLSGYATKNIAEFIAEGWAEFKNNKKPRPLAEKIGKIILTKRGK